MGSIIFFFIAIIIIVAVHEFGHYAMAKCFGVRVERFSIGFGKVLFAKEWKQTEWCISMIPLGGYVKMLDTQIQEVEQEDIPYAFDQQVAWKKILIYLAGPVVNLILAVFLFSLVFYHSGIISIKPEINFVAPYSLAEKAGLHEGDVILEINHQPVEDFSHVSMLLFENLEKGLIQFHVMDAQGNKQIRSIDTHQFSKEVQNIILGKAKFGISPYRLTNQLVDVVPDSPAAKAGLKKGDIIIALNQQEISNYIELVNIIRSHPGQSLMVVYQREGKKFLTTIIPDKVEIIKDSAPIGQIGIKNNIDEILAKKNQRIYYPSLLESVKIAISKTIYVCQQTLGFLGRMLIGNSSLFNINGPITTAVYASETAAMGLIPYLMFLALVSISIGILNLLPVPMLDGGGVLFSFLEWIRGKPLSQSVQEIALRFGFLFIVLLMFISFFNDFVRIFG